MALRRRTMTPPYEVMGVARPSSSPQQHGAPVIPGGPTVNPSVISKAPQQTARPSGGMPMVYRVPQGWVVAAGVVFVAAVALAYWVGSSRGFAAGKRVVIQQRDDEARVAASITKPTANTTVTPSPNTVSDPAAVPFTEDHPLGQRQPGLNYLLLASYNKSEADRLVVFLGSNGVEATVIPSTIRGLFQIVALRGFTGEERVGPGRKFEQQIKELGRKWKRDEKGPDEFEHAFWEKYSEPRKQKP